MAREHSASRPRKRPRQARSKQTVEWVLEAAARVFRAEGFSSNREGHAPFSPRRQSRRGPTRPRATTNRIAELAGVSIGTLYEYFPNKDALLVALAERHVQTAEQGIAAVLAGERTQDNQAWLAALQAAILASHRYPSQALELVADARAGVELRARATALRERVLAALCERARASGLPEPELRARAVFGAIAELSSRTLYEAPSAEAHAAIARHLLAMALAHLSGA